MSADLAVTCPGCGSAVRRGSDWCTLCYADLRPVPPPRPSAGPPPRTSRPGPGLRPEPTPDPVTGAVAIADVPQLPPLPPLPESGEQGPPGPVSLPCATCQQPVLLEVGVCPRCGSGLFDQLKAEAPTLRLPIIGDLLSLGKGASAAVAIGAAAVIVAVLIAVVTLLGSVL